MHPQLGARGAAGELAQLRARRAALLAALPRRVAQLHAVQAVPALGVAAQVEVEKANFEKPGYH